MQLNALGSGMVPTSPPRNKLLRIMRWSRMAESHCISNKIIVLAMKLTALILLTTCLAASAKGKSQGINLNVKNAPLEKVFTELKKQSGYSIFYNYRLLEGTKPVTVNLKNASVQNVLNAVLKDQPLDYEMAEKSIVIVAKAVKKNEAGAYPTLVAVPPLDIKGRVVNENGEPVVGASVQVKGTTKGTITDAYGYFELKRIDEDATLLISSVNSEPVEIRLNGKADIRVQLVARVNILDDVLIGVQTGYQNKKPNEITGSVSYLREKDLIGVSNQSILQNLQGKVAGLNVGSNSGSPESVSSITIRGVGSLGGGGSAASGQTSTQPLIVIDGILQESSGILNPLSYINPSDILSITVLKDAASTAVYGSRAANGVLVITTKASRLSGSGTINFSATYGSDNPSFGKFRMLNSEEQIELAREAFTNTFKTLFNPNATQAQIDAFIAGQGVPAKATESTPWYKLPYKEGRTQNYFLSFTAGESKFKYYLSGGYFREVPTKVRSRYEAITLRASAEHRFNDKVTLTSGLNVVSNRMHNGEWNGLSDNPLNGTSSSDVFKFILPYDVPYNANGSLKQGIRNQEGWRSIIPNPMLGVEYNRRENNTLFFSGDFKASVKLTSWLEASSSNRLSSRNTASLDYQSPLDRTSTYVNQGGRVLEGTGNIYNLITSNLLRAEHNFGGHRLSGLLGHEFNGINREVFIASANDLMPNGLQTVQGGRKNLTASREKLKVAFLSFFGLADYSFSSKYFLTASARRDASSKFGQSHKYGNFYSVGGAWQVSNEPFLRAKKVLTGLRVRASYGTTGNADPVREYASFGLYSIVTPGNGIITPYNGQYSIVPALFENPDLHWEVQKISNLGFDLGLFNRVQFAVDVYNKVNKDLLQTVILPGTSGIAGGGMTENIGSIRNRGVEVSVSSANVKGAFTWNTDLSFAYNKNKVIAVNKNEDITSGVLSANVVRVGQPLYSWYLPVFAGVDPNSGRAQWEQLEKDANGIPTGNKKLVTNPALATRQLAGSPFPTWVGGLNNNISYRGVSLAFLFTFNLGNKILNLNRVDVDTDGYLPFLAHAALPEGKTRWHQVGDIADYPKLFAFQKSDASYPTTRFLEDGSYLRLKNVRLTYSIPRRILSAAALKKADIFISADNIRTFTRFSGIDPELGGNGYEIANKYPLTKKLLAGVTITL